MSTKLDELLSRLGQRTVKVEEVRRGLRETVSTADRRSPRRSCRPVQAQAWGGSRSLAGEKALCSARDTSSGSAPPSS